MAPCSRVPRLAEIMGEYLVKGSQVYLKANCKHVSGKKNGTDRYTTEIVARDMQMLGSKGESKPKQEGFRNKPADKPTTASDFADDDIPF